LTWQTGSERKRRVSSVNIFVTTTQALLSYFAKMPIKIPVSHFSFCSKLSVSGEKKKEWQGVWGRK